jgi:glycerol-1-phosphate dehydrogenase [NAD(P)+]
MRFLLEGKKPILHGTKVGIGAVLIARLYELLREQGLSKEEILTKTQPEGANWEEEINKAFLDSAAEVILLEKEAQKNSLDAWSERIKVIAERWEQIYQVLATVPLAEEIVGLIKAVDGVVDPGEVGIEPDLVKQGLLYAKEVRPRYTILQLLWDLGYLQEYAQTILGG